jgi:ABC transport system ATP-binding/permease protein
VAAARCEGADHKGEGENLGELAGMKDRARIESSEIEFGSNDRKMKQLITLEGVSSDVGERQLFHDLTFSITAGMRVGLVGPNGSGKTTLLRLIKGEVAAKTGKIKRAEETRIAYFDQNRELDPELTLRRALAPDSDAVIYQGRVIHVAAWAERFLFEAETLNQRVGRLSGGERARVLIAQLMLQPADVLLLDEPTNDLDIPTLEILEESLLEYEGALVLVTHDRFLLDRVSNVVLGLDGAGAVERFADFRQWEGWLRERSAKPSARKQKIVAPEKASGGNKKPAGAGKKLTYLEAREFEAMENKIREAEAEVASKKAELENPKVAKDRVRLHHACHELDGAQARVEELYARWAELEQKRN